MKMLTLRKTGDHVAIVTACFVGELDSLPWVKQQDSDNAYYIDKHQSITGKFNAALLPPTQLTMQIEFADFMAILEQTRVHWTIGDVEQITLDEQGQIWLPGGSPYLTLNSNPANTILLRTGAKPEVILMQRQASGYIRIRRKPVKKIGRLMRVLPPEELEDNPITNLPKLIFLATPPRYVGTDVFVTYSGFVYERGTIGWRKVGFDIDKCSYFEKHLARRAGELDKLHEPKVPDPPKRKPGEFVEPERVEKRWKP